MNNEEKELLLTDLCARLTYGVFVEYDYGDGVKRVTKFHGNYLYLMMLGKLQWKDFKPYLRPMSSMTDVERKDYQYITERWMYDTEYSIADSIDWLNANHFDYRGLIEKGLAIKAPKGMYQN